MPSLEIRNGPGPLSEECVFDPFWTHVGPPNGLLSFFGGLWRAEMGPKHLYERWVNGKCFGNNSTENACLVPVERTGAGAGAGAGGGEGIRALARQSHSAALAKDQRPAIPLRNASYHPLRLLSCPAPLKKSVDGGCAKEYYPIVKNFLLPTPKFLSGGLPVLRSCPREAEGNERCMWGRWAGESTLEGEGK